MTDLAQFSAVELALTDFRAVSGYEAAFFSPELRERAIRKAGEIVAGAFAGGRSDWQVPDWITDLQQNLATASDPQEMRTVGELGWAKVLNEASEGSPNPFIVADVAQTYLGWGEVEERIQDTNPTYTEREARVVRAALAWSALTAVDPSFRLQARIAQQRYDRLPGKIVELWANSRYGVAHTFNRLARWTLNCYNVLHAGATRS